MGNENNVNGDKNVSVAGSENDIKVSLSEQFNELKVQFADFRKTIKVGMSDTDKEVYGKKITDLKKEIGKLKKKNTKSYSPVRLLFWIAILSVSFFLIAALLSHFLNFGFSDDSIILTFVGIAATFIVVSNYMQTMDIKREFKSKLEEYDSKVEMIVRKEVYKSHNEIFELLGELCTSKKDNDSKLIVAIEVLRLSIRNKDDNKTAKMIEYIRHLIFDAPGFKNTALSTRMMSILEYVLKQLPFNKEAQDLLKSIENQLKKNIQND